jgi:hypothetical protein
MAKKKNDPISLSKSAPASTISFDKSGSGPAAPVAAGSASKRWGVLIGVVALVAVTAGGIAFASSQDSDNSATGSPPAASSENDQDASSGVNGSNPDANSGESALAAGEKQGATSQSSGDTSTRANASGGAAESAPVTELVKTGPAEIKKTGLAGIALLVLGWLLVTTTRSRRIFS